jgi:hypothetical protein
VSTVIVPTVTSIVRDPGRAVPSEATFFIALRCDVRIGVLIVFDLIERRFAEFAGVPYHDAPSRQQWEELWDAKP